MTVKNTTKLQFLLCEWELMVGCNEQLFSPQRYRLLMSITNRDIWGNEAWFTKLDEISECIHEVPLTSLECLIHEIRQEADELF